jgi:vancomycin permeability regulator SanA
MGTLGAIVQAEQAARGACPPFQADAVVVLGAMVLPQRPCRELQARLDHAIRLWREQCAPLLMVSGGGQGIRDEIRVMTRYLLDQRVPGPCILPCAPGRNTWESLCSLQRLQQRYGMRRFVLVSSGYHAARMTWIANQLALEVVVSAPPWTPETEHWQTLQRQRLRELIAWERLRLWLAIRARISPAIARPPAVAEVPAAPPAEPAVDLPEMD